MKAQRVALKPVPDGKLRIALVYQAGIANLFHVVSHAASADGTRHIYSRVFQGDFRAAENMAYGLALAGSIVRSYACNRAGDVASVAWDTPMDEAPFRDSQRRQEWN